MAPRESQPNTFEGHWRLQGGLRGCLLQGEQRYICGVQSQRCLPFLAGSGCFHDSRCCNSLSHQFQSKGFNLLLRTAWVAVGREPTQSARNPYFPARVGHYPSPITLPALTKQCFNPHGLSPVPVSSSAVCGEADRSCLPGGV